ncbi:hypothetical protein EVA_10112 [gut metagenome]|uniref:Uncharacterized protein n=1 Tax=gut metagenome TaxID=749906 RepID=J9G3J0_9ZZZZ
MAQPPAPRPRSRPRSETCAASEPRCRGSLDRPSSAGSCPLGSPSDPNRRCGPSTPRRCAGRWRPGAQWCGAHQHARRARGWAPSCECQMS